MSAVVLSFSLTVIGNLCAENPTSKNSVDRFGLNVDEQRTYVGLADSNCFSCHGRTETKSDQTADPDIQGRSGDGWFLGNELTTWSKSDVHYHAFYVLQNELSQQMARQMGVIDKETKKSLIHRDRRCLACHSSVPWEQMTMPDNVIPAGDALHDVVATDTVTDARYRIGIACEACHGPSGKSSKGTDGWGASHIQLTLNPSQPETWWRTLSAQKKYDLYGYWDIHSTRTRTRICLSCHSGNVEQGKVITHEMYAAGHPPLPSFELSQFVHQMPRHWRRFDEKEEKLQDDFLARCSKLPDMSELAARLKSSRFPETKETMIAALVVLEESVRLAGNASSSRKPFAPPELANYACYGCHHELMHENWRKTRRLSSVPGLLTLKPGRPTLHEWPFSLSSAVLETVDGIDKDSLIIERLRGVEAALNARPFGDESLKPSTDGIADAAKHCSDLLNARILDEAVAERFLRNVAASGSQRLNDYDSARQLVWALKTTASELDPKGERSDRVQVLNDLDKQFVSVLKANRKDQVVNRPPDAKPLPHENHQFVDVSVAYKQFVNFDPRSVQKIFLRLHSDGRTDKSDAK